jgi:hypothetical protein
MDARHVQDAVELIAVACERIRELRRRRIGNRTTHQLRDDLAVINRGMTRFSVRGMLLGQKVLWLHHDHVLNELGNLQAMLQAVQPFLDEEEVWRELERDGYSVHKAAQGLAGCRRMIQNVRADVDAHEQLVHQALGGMPTPAAALEQRERGLLDFHDWEDAVLHRTRSTVERIAAHPQPTPSFLPRAAAALVLAMASTATG